MAAGCGLGDGGGPGGLRREAFEAGGRSPSGQFTGSAGARRVRGPNAVGGRARAPARAIGYGTLGVFLGALQGASDGADWSRWGGGWSSDGAWIGAAAGAGVGFLIGFVTGLAKAGTGWGAEPATSPACQAELAEATALAEESPQAKDTK